MKAFFSLFIYRIVFLLLTPLLLLALLIRSRTQAAYRSNLAQRFGWLPSSFKKGGIVIHASSVGEVLALKSFINKVIAQYPNLPITVTTFTPTGLEQVNKIFGDRVQSCFLPLDVFPCTFLFLRTLMPKAMVFMETELWPNLIHQAKGREIKLQLINGRLSPKSVRQYLKLSWLITPTLNKFDNILTQSDDNLANFLTLGADSDKSQCSGNLKYDIAITDEIQYKQQELAQFLPQNRPVWLVASTHQGDEQIMLSAYEQLVKNQPELLLVLVPRHPERFDEVASLCTDNGYSLVRRSEKLSVTDQHIWLIDTLGELMPIFGHADVVTMGGSFSTIGGHNPLEPALFAKPLIVGADMHNFEEVMTQLHNASGVKQIAAEQAAIEGLVEQLQWVFDNPEQAKEIGLNAQSVVANNQGATQVSLDKLAELVG